MSVTMLHVLRSSLNAGGKEYACPLELVERKRNNLTSTRTKQLDKSVNKIEDLKNVKEIES